MMTEKKELGGRLPLLTPEQLEGGGKKLYEQVNGTLIPWANESGFLAKGPDGALLGPFNAMLYSPEIATAQTAYLQAERDHTTLSPQIREVVILTTGAIWKASYELYAHRAVAAKQGLSEKDINSLCAGDPPMEAGAEAIMAHRFVHSIVKTHTIAQTIYEEALAVFGHRKLVDMVHLTSLYMATSAMLNAFAVPTPE